MELITVDDFTGSINLSQLGNTYVAQDLRLNYIIPLQSKFLSTVLGSYGATVILPENDAVPRFTTLRDYLIYAYARYVYWFYIDDLSKTSTSSGKAAMKQENAIKISVVDAQVKAWNEMVSNLQDMYAYIASSALYPEFDISLAKPLYVQNRFGL